MSAENPPTSSRRATVMAIASVLAALVLLIGMTIASSALWVLITFVVMVGCAVLALVFGIRQWAVPGGKRAVIVAIIVLALGVFLFVWGSFSAEIAPPG